MAKICAIKVESFEVKIGIIEKEIAVDDSIDKYIKEVKESVKNVKKAHIILNKGDKDKRYNIDLDSQNPIYQALRLTPISELDYII